MTQQMQGMEQVINQLMADREGKQAEIQVDREKLAVDSRKVDIDVMNAETNRMEAEIKNKEADIKAAVAMKEKAPDNTAIVVKQMDNETKNVEIAQKGQIEADRMNIEEQKLELEKQKFALEQFKAQSEANQDLAEIGAYTKTEMIITDEE